VLGKVRPTLRDSHHFSLFLSSVLVFEPSSFSLSLLIKHYDFVLEILFPYIDLLSRIISALKLTHLHCASTFSLEFDLYTPPQTLLRSLFSTMASTNAQTWVWPPSGAAVPPVAATGEISDLFILGTR
jgi:hypothetical protein